MRRGGDVRDRDRLVGVVVDVGERPAQHRRPRVGALVRAGSSSAVLGNAASTLAARCWVAVAAISG